MDNVNNHKEDSKPENNYFNEELKRMIEQIKSIREIEWRTDIQEDKNMEDIKVRLGKIEKDFYGDSNMEKSGQNTSSDSENTKQSEAERKCKMQFDQWSIKARYYWRIVWAILAVFAFNASWLVIIAGIGKANCNKTILFLAGGVLILLFLAIIVIVLARQSKYILGCKDKAEDE